MGVIIPPISDAQRRSGGCPHCGHGDWTGKRALGTVLFSCTKCRGTWSKGSATVGPTLPPALRTIIPSDPTALPVVGHEKDASGNWHEVRYRPNNPAPAFRFGLPEGDER
jgi:ribosomal protein L37AE/L43A